MLFGMSNIPQMQDNFSYMKEFKPLNTQEQATVRKAQESMNGIKSIPYITCPQQINVTTRLKECAENFGFC